MIAEPLEPPAAPDLGALPSSDGLDGDAAVYLDELIVATPADAPPQLIAPEALLPVELVGPHLRLSGSLPLGRFRRLSDVLNQHDGLLELRETTVLRRTGTPTRVRTPAIWVNPPDVTIVGQREVPLPSDAAAETPPDWRIEKERHALVVVTPGHVLTGDVYVPVGGQLAVFIESPDPAFIPMTDVRTRSLADRRIITRYPFALLNRRHIVATTELPEGTSSRAWAI